jgi:hypothetical protein
MTFHRSPELRSFLDAREVLLSQRHMYTLLEFAPKMH